METDSKVITLLFLAVVASGCIHSSGENTVTEGPESVTIQSIQVSPSEIYDGQNVRASLTAFNSGNIPADVLVGENGTRMLTDYCPDIFDNNHERFSASTSTTAETRQDEGAKYRLAPGEKIDVRWLLEQEGNVPLIGKRCDMSFSVPFNYSVEAYRQIQIKQDRDTEGSPKLNSESSSGPLVMALETLPGATGRQGTYVVESQDGSTGDSNIQLMMQMINEKPQEEYRKGLVDIHKESFYVEATDPLQLDEEFVDGEWVVRSSDYSNNRCEMPDADFTMYEGRSVTIQCDIPVPDVDQPSELSEISAGVNYTYIKDGGQRTVKVEPRG